MQIAIEATQEGIDECIQIATNNEHPFETCIVLSTVKYRP